MAVDLNERPAVEPTDAPATPPRARVRRRRRWISWGMLLIVVVVFVAKMANYVWPEAIRFSNIGRWLSHEYGSVSTWFANQPLLHSCGRDQQMADVPGGYVCTTGAQSSPYARIFATYPLSGGPREAIYRSIRAGTVAGADDILGGLYDVPRYGSVAIAPTSQWSADPFSAGYWRYYYYSLQPTVNLLVAYEKTGRHRYANTLLRLDNSFFADEPSSPLAWADDNTVAFRGMVLTYQWWELRRLHLLSETESNAFLSEVAKTADFLADPNHYEPELENGTNESAALLELGVDFPDLPGAANWRATASTRLAQSLQLLFSRDGTLLDSSPYYQFHAMDKFSQIYQFTRSTAVPIAADFGSRLREMTNYATYILQPNDSVPLLGASLEETIQERGSFAGLARADPSLQYVLSHGESGVPPPRTSVTFPSLGQTVMHSAWRRGSAFADAAYLTFNVGTNRTPHSDLDALGLTLYDDGASLLPGSGLFTSTQGAMSAYFRGTLSHNTVVVDGASQQQGAGSAGPLVQRDGVTYQSGFSPLYDGVRQLRTVMMLDKNHFLVIDRLSSQETHTYQQMFHLFPGARLDRQGLTATGIGTRPNRSITIQQLESARMSLTTTIGQLNPPRGMCSAGYQVAEPCYALSYQQRGRDAAYTTLISVGPRDPKFSISLDRARSRLVVQDHGRAFAIGLTTSPGGSESARATDPRPPAPITHLFPQSLPWSNWTPAGQGTASVVRAADDSGRRVLRLSAAIGTEGATDSFVRANLSASNLQIRIKLTNTARINAVMLDLSNRNWSSAARMNLRSSYGTLYDGEWMTISLGRDSSLSGVPGHWKVYPGFDWSSIDAAQIRMDVTPGSGPMPSVELDSLRSMPQQRKGAVVFVFDDGYRSIMPAARAMRAMNMPGNIAVIAKYTALPTSGYLNAIDLRTLQNRWGWNMVNHTQDHVDAVTAYYDRNALSAYEQDILNGATLLEDNGLNSAPNWLIYPFGATNAALARIVGRFYKFARTVDHGPEAYPFGSPLRVKTFLVTYPGDLEGNVAHSSTPPSQILAAARDAVRYHTSLILTFHRIKALTTDVSGYPIGDFWQVLRGLKRLGVPVMTLSQLDAMNGVPEDNRIIFHPAVAPLTTVTITELSASRATGFPAWPLLATIAAVLAAGSLAVIRRALRRR